MSFERVVIVAYKPFPGKEAELDELIKTHVAILSSEGLASEREPTLLKAKDGTLVEIFGWKSKQAIEDAHSNVAVQKMWERLAHALAPLLEMLKSNGALLNRIHRQGFVLLYGHIAHINQDNSH